MTKSRTVVKFSEEWLDDHDISANGDKVVRDEIIDHNRWSLIHEVIFLNEGRYYRVNYEVPATEMQECDTWDVRSDGMVDCVEAIVAYEQVARFLDA